MLELVEDFGRTDKFIEMKGAFVKVEHSFEPVFNSVFENLGVEDAQDCSGIACK